MGALVALVATPVLGSATSLANSPFGVKALNTDGSGKYAIKGLKLGTGSTPEGGSTGQPDAPAPSIDPAPVTADTKTTMVINTSLPSCNPKQFNITVASSAAVPNEPVTPLRATVDWGDGSAKQDLVTGSSANLHSYASGKEYTLTVDGTLNGFSNQNEPSVNCIKAVTHFGEDSGIKSLRYMFANSLNIQEVAAPPQSTLSTFAMFYGASSFKGNTSDWRLPNAINMANMFNSASSFNGDLSNLGASKATNLGSMFYRASSFNGNISNWDVSKSTSFSLMFAGASKFNQNISSWDTGSATDMSSMFNGATIFSQNLSIWDVANVKSYGNFSVDSKLTTLQLPKFK